MTDPFLTRDWAEQHHRFSDDLAATLSGAWRTLKTSLDRVHRYEFDAPWQRLEGRRGRRTTPRAAA